MQGNRDHHLNFPPNHDNFGFRHPHGFSQPRRPYKSFNHFERPYGYMHRMNGSPIPQRSFNQGPRGQWNGNKPFQNNFPRSGNFQENVAPDRRNHDEYWCETCDREFKSHEILASHKLEHQVCNIDGCKFTAHPKVITKHIQMQHSSGLYTKIAKLSTPEEIKKWVDERKNKYPTKVNVEKKKLEIEEKVKRGEKLGIFKKRFGGKNDSANRNNLNTNNNNPPFRNNRTEFKRNKSKRNSRKFPILTSEPKLVSLDEPNRNIKPFRGIDEIYRRDVEDEIEPINDKTSFIIDDDDWLPNSKTIEVKHKNEQKIDVCGALNNLICSYASSDEEANKKLELSQKKDACKSKVDKDIVTEIKEDILNKGETKLIHTTAAIEQYTNDNVDVDSGPEEIKIERNDSIVINDEINECKEMPKGKRQRKHKPVLNNSIENTEKLCNNGNLMKKPINKYFRRTPSTLLEKLLYKEITHERNVVLQCIRHIVKNNYFIDQ